MAEPEVKDPEIDDKSEDGKTKHEPPEGSKRFNEIYAEAKQGKRDTEALTKKVDDLFKQNASLEEQNAALQEAMEVLNSKVSETGKPDPMLDPEGYETWLTDKIAAKLKKDISPPKDPKPAETAQSPSSLETQILVQKGLHTDYVEVVTEAEKEMAKNPYLNAQIRGAEDPAKAAYDYGIKQREERRAESDANRGQGHVEAGSYPIGKTGINLTPAQIAMADKLGVKRESYAKRLAEINRS